MTDGRPSGELEGSTLGSSSRDGHRRGGSLRQRGNPSSGGFLVDSSFLPQRKPTRNTSHHEANPPETAHGEKRSAPDSEIPRRSKKSMFQWPRQKHLDDDRAPSASASTGTTNTRDGASVEGQDGQESAAMAGQEVQPRANVGLDRDSLQIVNLALNLSESRKRSASARSGVSAGQIGRRVTSSGQSSVPHADLHLTPDILPMHGSRVSSQTLADFVSNTPRSDVLPPASVVTGLVPSDLGRIRKTYGLSPGTRARAEKARRHFELFSEYLRLLEILPPLNTASTPDHSESSVRSDPHVRIHRVYNPLQSIRNRKIRFRAHCVINAEAEGWNNVQRVHEWIDSVEACYEQADQDPSEILKLPPFQLEEQHQQGQAHNSMEPALTAVSPPSSLHGVTRSGNSKPRRPRFDWNITPAELLADAAWVEDGLNKKLIVDRDGNKLFPEGMEITVDNGRIKRPQRVGTSVLDKHQAPVSEAPDSAHNSSRGQSLDMSRITRGRQKHRFQSPSPIGHSRSMSENVARSQLHEPGQRSISPSNESLVDDAHALGKDGQTQDSKEPRISANPVANIATKFFRSGDSPAPRVHREPEALEDDADVRRQSLSSVASVAKEEHDSRISLEEINSTGPNSPAQPSYFPSIAVNLSPPPSRSPSPTRRPLSRAITSFHERNKSKHRNKGIPQSLEGHPTGSGTLEMQAGNNISPVPANSIGRLEPSPLPDRISPDYRERPPSNNSNRQDTSKFQKILSPQDSKLRGIFKTGGRIAGIVGNEVSRVGDRILKKDQALQSRASSLASSVNSDEESDDGEYDRGNAKLYRKPPLHRLPTYPGGSARVVRRDTRNASPGTFIPQLPTFTPRMRQEGRDDVDERPTPDSNTYPRPDANRKGLGGEVGQGEGESPSHGHGRTADGFNVLFSSSTRREGTKDRQTDNLSVPFTLNRPPVTGLARADAAASQQSMTRRPSFGGASRAFSISGRSIATLNGNGLPDRREIGRTKALLLSSGIKAREITRRAETLCEPSIEMRHMFDGHAGPVPKLTRLSDFDFAAQILLRNFESSRSEFQQSVDRFSQDCASPLKSQLRNLEALVSHSLSPRVRQAAADAENLSVQLNTTSTLAVKQLSDSLDKGLRKRRRRFRWVRRTGFVMLEWALVGVLWWVWLLVMAFKVFRGVFRGLISGVRWMLWL